MNHILPKNTFILLWHLEHYLPTQQACWWYMYMYNGVGWLHFDIASEKAPPNLSQIIFFKTLRLYFTMQSLKTDLFIYKYFCHCSRRLLRKSHRLGRRNFQHGKHARFNKRHHFQEKLSKHQKHGLDYYEKKALEFSKYQDKINILKNKHARVYKLVNPVRWYIICVLNGWLWEITSW